MTQTHRDQWLFSALLILLFWAPLPFGSNRPWAAALLSICTLLLVTLWLILQASGKLPRAAGHWQRIRLPLGLLLLVQLWVFLQTLPLPREWVEWLSPRAAALHQPADHIPLTLDLGMTRFQLLLGLCHTGVFVLTAMLVNSRQRLVAVLWTLTLSGAFQGIYGSLMTLSGLEYGFFVEKYAGRGVATGTFVNRNHLAGYLVMCLAAGIGLLISQLGSDTAQSRRARVRSFVSLVLSAKFLLRLLLATMVVALVLTRSRMGNLAFFVSLALAGSAVLLLTRHRFSRRMVWLFASLLLVDLLIVGQWFGAREVAERLLQTSGATEVRDDVAQLTLGIVRDFPWTGSGAGTYYTVFPHYSNVALQGDYYSHAHNDYLELAGDLGLPAFCLLAAVVLLSVLKGISLQSQSDSRLMSGLGFTVLMSALWALMHATADFNLQVPANAFTFVVLLALAWFDSNEKRSNSRELQSQDCYNPP